MKDFCWIPVKEFGNHRICYYRDHLAHPFRLTEGKLRLQGDAILSPAVTSREFTRSFQGCGVLSCIKTFIGKLGLLLATCVGTEGLSVFRVESCEHLVEQKAVIITILRNC